MATRKPDADLAKDGWHFFSVASAGPATRDLVEEQRERFLDVLVVDSGHGERNREVYVKAYPRVPEGQFPGGGFVQVGCRRPNEAVDEQYMLDINRSFRRKTGKDVSSVLIMPGPYFAPSGVVHGQFERISTYDRLVWVR